MSSNRHDRPTAESRLTDTTAAGTSQVAVEPGLPEIGTVIVNKYLLERLLGQGGMGAVYAARHLITGKRVAVKWLREDPERNRDAAARLAREARAAGRVNHPNVVDIYDAGFSGRHPFMVMELLEGEPLDARIARAPLSVSETVELMLPVLRGVSAAHASGIVHRDLKPGNIFLCVDPESRQITPKVLDFGVSKLSVGVEEDLTVTSTGVQVGTPAFMAPEQVCGEPVDARSDVYALSVTLYQTLTGRLPFEGRVRHELFSKVLTQRALPPSTYRKGLPSRLDALILRGLERDPRRRFSTVQELGDALASYQTRARWWRWPLERPQRRVSRRLLSVLGMVLLTALWFLLAAEPSRERARAVRAQPLAESTLLTPAQQHIDSRVEDLQSTVSEPLVSSLDLPKPPSQRVTKPAKRRVRVRVPETTTHAKPRPVLPEPEHVEPDRFMSW